MEIHLNNITPRYLNLFRKGAPVSMIEDLKKQLEQEKMESMLAHVGVDGVLIHSVQEFPQSLMSSNL